MSNYCLGQQAWVEVMADSQNYWNPDDPKAAAALALATPGQGNYRGLLGRVESVLSARSPKEQFLTDAAMWYGAITYSATQSQVPPMLRNLLSVLYWGGLMVQKTDGWVPWSGTDAPICSSISHGARVLISLPESDNG